MVAETSVDITPDLDGGVMKTIIREGEGVSKPSSGCKVTVHYEGKLDDGTVFDSSKQREPFEFTLGKGEVIKAWDIGIATMRKGEIAVFVCNSEYAYGKVGSPPTIPANATLTFEVEMLHWKAEDLSPKKDGGIIRTILDVGSGFSSPSDFSVVDIHLTGEYEGRVFDDRDVIFSFGEGSEYGICEGVEKALEKFKVKEKSTLQIKSKYAFGETGNAEFGIPPNADIEYTVHLKNLEKLPEFWSLGAFEKLEQAVFFKEKGNKYVKEAKYPLAIKFYQKMENYVGSDIGFSESEEQKRDELKKAMHLNLALCYLKQNRNIDARHECDTVLENDPNNEKALFRRGQSYLNTAEAEQAKRDFELVLKNDAKNATAIKNVKLCNDILKQQRSQEKKIYANMFEKFAKHDKERQNWVYGWWDGKKVDVEKYVPPESEQEELLQRKKEREAILKDLERRRAQVREVTEANAAAEEQTESGESGQIDHHETNSEPAAAAAEDSTTTPETSTTEINM